MSTTATKLSRDARKAETRRALVDAASELFARQGIEATSIDEIAAAVGLTKGAVYAHFASKRELADEALRAANATVGGDQVWQESAGLGDFFTKVGREIATLLPRIPRQSLMLYLEYLLYVIRDPDRHRIERRQNRVANTENGAEFERTAEARGLELPLPGAEIIALLNATGVGLALAYMLDERAVSREAVERLFAAIGYGLQQEDAVNELLSTRPNT